jgi:xylan 1,4-beta-xylosidase
MTANHRTRIPETGRLLSRVALYSSLMACVIYAISVRAASVELTIDPSQPGEMIDLTRYALGQGGLSDKPMFEAHVEQIAQLHPQTIRIFVQEYFDLYPRHHRYNWTALDKVIETVLATKAKPLLCLCFKPKALYPKIDQTIVHPTSYKEWDELIYRLVRHCNRDKKFGIEYWEIANEPDIGEDGGCPYLFQPADYVTYYEHTARAILRADPKAKVGGPALAGYNSEIGTALIERCGTNETPLHFFSWHVYDSQPESFRKSIREVKAKLGRFPKLQSTETIIDEWNMSLDEPVLDPAFQPAFVLETTLGFFEERLSRSGYYHIQDAFVDESRAAKFLSQKGAAFGARWWNDLPQYDGLYDNQGQVRPTFYAFKLLSLVRGQKLTISGATPDVKGFAAKNGRQVNAVIWNFPSDGKGEEQEVTVRISASKKGRFTLTRLEPRSHFNQLELQRRGQLGETETAPLQFKLRPYEVRWIALE